MVLLIYQILLHLKRLLLKNKSFPVSSDEDIINVGTISANGDTEIGKLIVEAMGVVGREGVISVEEAKGFHTNLEVEVFLQHNFQVIYGLHPLWLIYTED